PSPRARKDDHVGPLGAHRLLDDLERRVRAEEEHAPAAAAEGEPEDHKREIVQLPRRAREERARPESLVPAARETEQPAAEQVRREVLLGDRDVALRPTVSELAQ